jgi:hypothetical protein
MSLGSLFTPLLFVLSFSELSAQGMRLSVRGFGARGDGVTDDTMAINSTIEALAAGGGGECYLPRGVYLVGTLSSDAMAHASFIVPRNNVSIVGAGPRVSIIMVAAGANRAFYGRNGPNVIATQQETPLINCRFAGFAVDWTAKGNLLTKEMLPRNNASLLSLNGGINILVEDLIIRHTPGNQCVFFPAGREQGQKNIVVRRCVFENSGSGLRGNYNIDHSSVYINGDGTQIEDCNFISRDYVAGTCFEIHGGGSIARNCRGKKYYRGFYIASDYRDIETVYVSSCRFEDCWTSFDYSAPRYRINDVIVEECEFRQSATAVYSIGQSFIAGTSPGIECHGLIIRNCLFYGSGRDNCRLMMIDRTSGVLIANCRFARFSDIGVWVSGYPLDDGSAVQGLRIMENSFIDVPRPIYINAPRARVFGLNITGNSFTLARDSESAAVLLRTGESDGYVGSNHVSRAYRHGVDVIASGVSVFEPVRKPADMGHPTDVRNLQK